MIAGLGKLTGHYNDAQAMLLVGKTALARGLPVDVYAFPDIGVPNYTAVGSKLDRCIVYAIVRTESGFDQGDMSSAKAVGLMIERIPFAETRNYVERVMENLQVYRKRFGDVTATIEPNLHRSVVAEPRPGSTAVELSFPH